MPPSLWCYLASPRKWTRCLTWCLPQYRAHTMLCSVQTLHSSQRQRGQTMCLTLRTEDVENGKEGPLSVAPICWAPPMCQWSQLFNTDGVISASQGRKVKSKDGRLPKVTRQRNFDSNSGWCPKLWFFSQKTFVPHEELSFHQPEIVEIRLLKQRSFCRIYRKRQKMVFAQDSDIPWF